MTTNDTTTKLTLIDDGNTRWIADTAELVATMRRLKWAVRDSLEGLIDEPEDVPADDDSDPDDNQEVRSYSALCSDVHDVEAAEEDATTYLTYRAELQAWRASSSLRAALAAE